VEDWAYRWRGMERLCSCLVGRYQKVEIEKEKDNEKEEEYDEIKNVFSVYGTTLYV
jgi:hypothetical protein